MLNTKSRILLFLIDVAEICLGLLTLSGEIPADASDCPLFFDIFSGGGGFNGDKDCGLLDNCPLSMSNSGTTF